MKASLVMSTLPVVGVPSCRKIPVEMPVFHVTEKYITPIVGRALPIIVPALGAKADAKAYAGLLDGLMLTGSPSNVEPGHYEGADVGAGPHDPDRDWTTLPLIRACVEMGVPIFAVCRGIQEFNVAMGGTLHQRVHDLPDTLDHRSRRDAPMVQKYRIAHPVRLTRGGRLAGILGAEEVMVNSLHGQGIDRVAPGLTVEALAPDGVVEAVSVTGSRVFQMGFQWHPEYPDPASAVSAPLYDAFIADCARHAAERARRGVSPLSVAAD